MKLDHRFANQIVKSAEIELGQEPNKCAKSLVQFRIEDVYVPDPAQILMELHGKDVLLGKIVDVSESAIQREAFAVVEVDALSQPVVVAMKYVKQIRRE